MQTGLGSAARTPRLRVEQASIADAINLRPVSRFAAPLSWRFRVGAIERTDEARYGGTAGVRIDWGGRGATTLSAQSRWWPLQDDPWTWGGQLEQAQAISRNAALWARWRVDEVRHAGLLGVRWYF